MKGEGIFSQLKRGHVIRNSQNKITRRHIKLAVMYLFGFHGIYGTYSDDKINAEEELDVALEHWKFLYKYGMVTNLEKRQL